MNRSNIAIAKELKKLRYRLNLNQTDLAKEIGVKKLTIVRWEKGLHTPHKVFLKLITVLSKTKKPKARAVYDDFLREGQDGIKYGERS